MNLNLLSNISDNYKFLKEDFFGVSFSLSGIASVLLYLFFSIFIVAIFYLFGSKVRLFLFGKYKENILPFIDIGLGYIFVTSGIAILGLFSFLYFYTIMIYLFSIIIIGIYPISGWKRHAGMLLTLLRKIYLIYKTNKWVFVGILLFVLMAFLRLIPPETGEDAISHNTSLPFLYLKAHSIMIDPKLSPSIVLPVPQLGNMLYVLTQSFDVKDASRYIHFIFYVLTLMLIYYAGKNIKAGGLSVLLFVTAPVVIQVSSKANADFQWLFCWLLSVILITNKNRTKKTIIISALIFGGVLATKLWAIVFLPIVIIYLMFTAKIRLSGINNGIFFLLISLLIPSLWYIRAYVLTGSLFYPVFSQVLPNPLGFSILSYVGFNKAMFNYENILKFSPLLFIGTTLFFFNKLNNLLKIIRSRLFLFFALLVIEFLFMRSYFYPRYLLGLYAITVVIVSLGIKNIIKFNVNKVVFAGVYAILFSYYFMNTLLVLPYGFGWADSNRYLTRVLSRDNSSYYDFDRLFDKWISGEDRLATYGTYGFYYANFDFINANYIFKENKRSFDLFVQKNITKLFINGGDILWFCKKLNLQNCSLNKVKLLAGYPQGIGKYNLYEIVTAD